MGKILPNEQDEATLLVMEINEMFKNIGEINYD